MDFREPSLKAWKKENDPNQYTGIDKLLLFLSKKLNWGFLDVRSL